MKVAALDLGSNTFLMLVAKVENGRVVEVFEDLATVTRLGQGVNSTGRFHPEALKRARECLKKYSLVLKAHEVNKVVAVATSAARDVTNRKDFLELGNQFNIPIQVISGELEANLTFVGSLLDGMTPEGVAVIDVGGGSTEVIGQTETGEVRGVSVDVGSVRLTEKFISTHPVPIYQVEELRNYVREQLGAAKKPLPSVSHVVAVAGTPTTMSAVIEGREFQQEQADGYELSVEVMEHWLDKLRKLSVVEREKLPGMQKGRADVIVAGLSILVEFVLALNCKSAVVSSRGVRYGAAMEWRELC